MNARDAAARRHGLARGVLVGAGLTVLGSTARGEGRKLTAGLVGCGGRGTGAGRDFLAAGKALGLDAHVTAVADPYPDRAEQAGNALGVPKERRFVGFDAYQKLIESGVDIVLLATPPNFRPLHFEAAIRAGKHVFTEKPVAVDPPGARKMLEMGALADAKKLSVVAGTANRHRKQVAGTQKVVAEGAIGAVRGGAIYGCIGRLWFRRREPGWNDAEYLVRNWVSFTALSGDLIVEQHIHLIDWLDWFLGTPPVAALAFGGRARRLTGDQYDFFSTDFEFPGGVHVHSMCRQVNGCWGRGGLELVGEKGWTNAEGVVRDAAGKPLPIPVLPWHDNMFVQEHIALLEGIVKGPPVNETRNVTEATLAAILARTSAYTGQRVTWDEMMKSDLVLRPMAADFEAGEVKAPPDDVVPVPGKD